MASLLDIGRSAILAQREALNVTGQNIVNANTEGYRRRDATLTEVFGVQSELTALTSQVGLGVKLGEVRRAYDSFLSESTRSTSARFEASDAFVGKLEQLENTILPNDGDLGVALTAFFERLGQIAANPGDLAPRAAAIEMGHTVSSAFNTTALLLGDLQSGTFSEIETRLMEVNQNLDALGALNGQLRSSNLGGTPPNSLLDERDRLIDTISAKVPLVVTIGERFDAELRMGASAASPVILSGEDAKTLSATQTNDGNLLFRIGSGQIVSQFESGELRGLVDAYGTTRRALDELDTLARNFSGEMNEQHAQGIDLEGQLGKELFAVAQFSPVASQANKGSAEVSVNLVPGRADQLSQMSMTFNAQTDHWVLADDTGATLGTGRGRIEIDGAVIDVSGAAQDQDKFTLVRDPGDASRLTFLLRRSEEIAAASTVVVYPDTTNLGTATLVANSASQEVSGLPSLTDTLANNLSPVAAQTFLRAGVVGSIPRGTQEITLASLATQTTGSVFAQEGADIAAITLVLDGASHSFALSPESVGALAWESGEEIAHYLNMGVLQSGSGQTLADLGISVSGSGSGLAFASDASSVFSGLSAVSSSGNSLGTNVLAEQAASDIRIFTREGRQIAGAPLPVDEVSQLLTVENGFNPEAEYRADYNTITSGTGYRGMSVIQNRAGVDPLSSGLNVVSSTLVGLRGSNDGLVSADSKLNSTVAQTLTLEVSTGAVRSFSIPPAVDAAYVAQSANETFAAMGVTANAMTAMRLTLDAPLSGIAQFDLTGSNGVPLTITAQVSNGDLSELVNSVNGRSEETGVRAELSLSTGSLTLVHDDGFDIGISNVSLQDIGFTVAVLDQEFQPLALDGNAIPAFETALSSEMRVSGTVQFASGAQFDIKSAQVGKELNTLSSVAEPMIGGLVTGQFTDGGTSAALRFGVDPVIDGAALSVDGTQVHAPSAQFKTEVKLAGVVTFSADVSGGEVPSAQQVAINTAAQLRSSAPIPALLGAAMQADDFPIVGTSAIFMIGGAEYTLERVDDGDPTRLSALDFAITGPEAGRIVPDLIEEDGDYMLSLGVVGGHLSGLGPKAVSDTMASAFGLASTQSSASVQGRGIDSALADGTYSMAVSLDGTQYDVDVTLAAGVYSVALPAEADGLLQASVVAQASGENALVLSALKAGLGSVSIVPSTEAQQLGFKVGAAEINVQDGVLHARSTNDLAIDIVAGGVSAAASYIHLTDIPDEELIVTIGGEGAKRLGAQFEVGPVLNNENRGQESFRVEMVDAASGRVELFDRVSGVSIATRTSNGIVRFNVSGQDLGLSGFAETGDSFNVATGLRAPGDSRNIDALAMFGQQQTGIKSFQDDFRAIAAGVGASLEAARLTHMSNEAVHEAAVAAESDLSGVNMDEEAAKLMSQQQAYQAAARILQTARELFDTLIQIA